MKGGHYQLNRHKENYYYYYYFTNFIRTARVTNYYEGLEPVGLGEEDDCCSGGERDEDVVGYGSSGPRDHSLSKKSKDRDSKYVEENIFRSLSNVEAVEPDDLLDYLPELILG